MIVTRTQRRRNACFDRDSKGNRPGERAYILVGDGPQGHTVLAVSLYENLSWVGLML